MHKNLQWHPAFCYAMRLEFRDEQGLQYTDEYNLTDKPLMIDLMIVRKNSNVPIKNKIGHIFKRHNIIEYKSPNDKMNINTFYKTLAYGCLYKVSPKHESFIDTKDITITLIRDKKPVKLLRLLDELGFEVSKYYNGIYYIANALFDMQIIVSSELSDSENKWIKALKFDISKKLYLSLCEDIAMRFNDIEKEIADNIMQVVATANNDSINEWKESEELMCEALREIMKDELEESKIEGKIEGKIETYYECGKTPEEIVSLVGMPLDYVCSILNL